MVLCRRFVGLCAVLVAGQILINQAFAAEAMLLDFGAEWCGPCRAMNPVVDQLIAEGYPVKRINVEQDKELTQKFKVTGLPTFIATLDGREVAREVGPLPKSQLIQLLRKAETVSSPADVRGPTISSSEKRPRLLSKLLPGNSSTPLATAKVGASGATAIPSADLSLSAQAVSLGNAAEGWEAAEASRVPARPVSDNGLASTRLAGNIGHHANSVNQPAGRNPISDEQLIRATVRLKIEDKNGISTGSGTIIDAREGEALILTCGHVFRECKKDGNIFVDLFGPNAPRKVSGKLVSYDLTSDVGLVRISANHPFVVAPVAPAGYSYKAGDRVITVGCDGGADATARTTSVVSIDRFRGPPNVQVAGAPVQGRSGGGLFSNDGMVIGVCNAADPEDNQGLFAAIGAIHSELDRAKLSFIYTRVKADAVASRSSAMAGKSMPRIMPRGNLDAETTVARSDSNSGTVNAAMASVRAVNGQTLTVDEEKFLSELRSMPSKSEVICLIRPLDDPTAKSRVLQVNNVSQAVWQGLAEDRAANSRGNLTSLETAKPTANNDVANHHAANDYNASGSSTNAARPNEAVRRMVSLDDADRVWPPRR